MSHTDHTTGTGRTASHLRAVDTMPGVDPNTYPHTARVVARATYTPRDARRMRRHLRRAYRGTRPTLAARVAGWITLGLVVAVVSGGASVMMGRHLDGIHRDAPTTTYHYHWSPECPTEDSCDQYGNPIVP